MKLHLELRYLVKGNTKHLINIQVRVANVLQLDQKIANRVKKSFFLRSSVVNTRDIQHHSLRMSISSLRSNSERNPSFFSIKKGAQVS